MRTTSVLYTCDRCKEKFPETEKGWYPIGWTRITILDIRSNMEYEKNKELCHQCSKELQRWINPLGSVAEARIGLYDDLKEGKPPK